MATGFIGFSAFASSAAGSHVDAPPTATPIYDGTDSDVRAVMKRMTKKDVVTKLKAIDELRELIPSRDKAVLKDFLPSWSYVYLVLVLHNDRRVRVGIHDVLTDLVAAGMRKSFAPFLPTMLPQWYMCCYDAMKDVSAAARRAFEALFPDTPRRVAALCTYAPQVIDTCVRHIHMRGEDMCDMRVCTGTDAAEAAERVHGCAITCLAGLLQTAYTHTASSGNTAAAGEEVDAAAVARLWDAVSECLRSDAKPAVWAPTLTHACASVRRCAARSLVCVCECAPHFIAARVGDAVPAVLSLAEPMAELVLTRVCADVSPLCVQDVWRLLLCVSTQLPGVWGLPTGDESHIHHVITASTMHAASYSAKFLAADATPPAVPSSQRVWPHVIAHVRAHASALTGTLVPLLMSMPADALVASVEKRGKKSKKVTEAATAPDPDAPTFLCDFVTALTQVSVVAGEEAVAQLCGDVFVHVVSRVPLHARVCEAVCASMVALACISVGNSPCNHPLVVPLLADMQAQMKRTCSSSHLQVLRSTVGRVASSAAAAPAFSCLEQHYRSLLEPSLVDLMTSALSSSDASAASAACSLLATLPSCGCIAESVCSATCDIITASLTQANDDSVAQVTISRVHACVKTLSVIAAHGDAQHAQITNHLVQIVCACTPCVDDAYMPLLSDALTLLARVCGGIHSALSALVRSHALIAEACACACISHDRSVTAHLSCQAHPSPCQLLLGLHRLWICLFNATPVSSAPELSIISDLSTACVCASLRDVRIADEDDECAALAARLCEAAIPHTRNVLHVLLHMHFALVVTAPPPRSRQLVVAATALEAAQKVATPSAIADISAMLMRVCVDVCVRSAMEPQRLEREHSRLWAIVRTCIQANTPAFCSSMLEWCRTHANSHDASCMCDGSWAAADRLVALVGILLQLSPSESTMSENNKSMLMTCVRAMLQATSAFPELHTQVGLALFTSAGTSLLLLQNAVHPVAIDTMALSYVSVCTSAHADTVSADIRSVYPHIVIIMHALTWIRAHVPPQDEQRYLHMTMTVSPKRTELFHAEHVSAYSRFLEAVNKLLTHLSNCDPVSIALAVGAWRLSVPSSAAADDGVVLFLERACARDMSTGFAHTPLHESVCKLIGQIFSVRAAPLAGPVRAVVDGANVTAISRSHAMAILQIRAPSSCTCGTMPDIGSNANAFALSRVWEAIADHSTLPACVHTLSHVLHGFRDACDGIVHHLSPSSSVAGDDGALMTTLIHGGDVTASEPSSTSATTLWAQLAAFSETLCICVRADVPLDDASSPTAVAALGSAHSLIHALMHAPSTSSIPLSSLGKVLRAVARLLSACSINTESNDIVCAISSSMLLCACVELTTPSATGLFIPVGRAACLYIGSHSLDVRLHVHALAVACVTAPIEAHTCVRMLCSVLAREWDPHTAVADAFLLHSVCGVVYNYLASATAGVAWVDEDAAIALMDVCETLATLARVPLFDASWQEQPDRVHALTIACVRICDDAHARLVLSTAAASEALAVAASVAPETAPAGWLSSITSMFTASAAPVVSALPVPDSPVPVAAANVAAASDAVTEQLHACVRAQACATSSSESVDAATAEQEKGAAIGRFAIPSGLLAICEARHMRASASAAADASAHGEQQDLGSYARACVYLRAVCLLLHHARAHNDANVCDSIAEYVCTPIGDCIGTHALTCALHVCMNSREEAALCDMSHALVQRFARTFPSRFRDIVQSFERAIQLDVEKYLQSDVSANMFAVETVGFQALDVAPTRLLALTHGRTLVLPAARSRPLTRVCMVECDAAQALAHVHAPAETRVTVESYSRTVTCVYVHEDARFNVRMSMPPMYPLKRAVVDVQCVGVEARRAKRWELQLLSIAHTHTWGTSDALAHWQACVRAELDGIEPCPICYACVSESGALPRLSCGVCKKRFHATCLRTWFATSHDSKCPMCRQYIR